MSRSTWRSTASAFAVTVVVLTGAGCGSDDQAAAEAPATSPTASATPLPTPSATTSTSAGQQADLDRIAELCEAMSGPDGAMQDAIAATRDDDTAAAQAALSNALEQVRDLAEEAEPFPLLAEDLDEYAEVLTAGGLDDVADARQDVDAGCYAAAADVG